MKLWYAVNTERVGMEKAAIEQLTKDEGWFVLGSWRLDALRLSANGVIKTPDAEYPVKLIYPDQYPLVPAWVEPQDSNAKWSSHQYGKGGSLCLELRPDNWFPDATGVDVLRSAFNLLKTENPLGSTESGRVPSAHHVGDLQAYDWLENPVLIGSGCLDRIRKRTTENIEAITWLAESDSVWPILLYDEVDVVRQGIPTSSDLGSLRTKLQVIIVRAEIPGMIWHDRTTFFSALNCEIGPFPDDQELLILIMGEKKLVPFHTPNSKKVFVRKWVILPDERGFRSGRSKEVADKKVAIIGLGSVGSKIAEFLLRSGINSLLLIDGDVFLPVNLERHILDWRDVGFRKVNAVKRRLSNIKPAARIDTYSTNLNWQQSARTYARQIDDLATCNLIVDATGDVPSALFLAAISKENEKPFVSVQVFEGGLGALVARSVPGIDPTYIDGRVAYDAYCEKENVTPPQSGRKSYEALTETGVPLIADDAAVAIAASHACRVILDILDECLGPADKPWMLIGCRKGWLFSCHGHVIGLDVGKPQNHSDISKDEDAYNFITGLIKEIVDASAVSS